MKKENDERIAIIKNGPYLISGCVPLAQEISVRDKKNVPAEWKLGKRYTDQKNYALCLCGISDNKPFCDGTHIYIRFNDGDKSL